MAKKLTQLGRAVAQPASPEEQAILESVPNPHPGTNYVVRFTAGIHHPVPDHRAARFRPFRDRLCAGRTIVESKSLKLYLNSFRNAAGFHEATTIAIAKRIVQTIKPGYLRIAGYWYPRGGIPIDVFWQTGKLPTGVWIPDTGVAPYRGRG